MLVGSLALLAEYKSRSLCGPQVCESSHADEGGPWTLWLMRSLDMEVRTEERMTTLVHILPEILGHVCCQIKKAGPHLQRSVSVRVPPELCLLWTSPETLWFWERMRKTRGGDCLEHRTLSWLRGAMVFVAFLGAVTKYQTEII